MTDACSSEFLGRPVRVHELDGQRVVVAGAVP